MLRSLVPPASAAQHTIEHIKINTKKLKMGVVNVHVGVAFTYPLSDEVF